jgi:hypothetical protein
MASALYKQHEVAGFGRVPSSVLLIYRPSAVYKLTAVSFGGCLFEIHTLAAAVEDAEGGFIGLVLFSRSSRAREE